MKKGVKIALGVGGGCFGILFVLPFIIATIGVFSGVISDDKTARPAITTLIDKDISTLQSPVEVMQYFIKGLKRFKPKKQRQAIEWLKQHDTEGEIPYHYIIALYLGKLGDKRAAADWFRAGELITRIDVLRYNDPSAQGYASAIKAALVPGVDQALAQNALINMEAMKFALDYEEKVKDRWLTYNIEKQPIGKHGLSSFTGSSAPLINEDEWLAKRQKIRDAYLKQLGLSLVANLQKRLQKKNTTAIPNPPIKKPTVITKSKENIKKEKLSPESVATDFVEWYYTKSYRAFKEGTNFLALNMIIEKSKKDMAKVKKAFNKEKFDNYLTALLLRRPEGNTTSYKTSDVSMTKLSETSYVISVTAKISGVTIMPKLSKKQLKMIHLLFKKRQQKALQKIYPTFHAEYFFSEKAFLKHYKSLTGKQYKKTISHILYVSLNEGEYKIHDWIRPAISPKSFIYSNIIGANEVNTAKK